MSDQDAPNESPITTNEFSLTPKTYLRIILRRWIWSLWGVFLWLGFMSFYLFALAVMHSRVCDGITVFLVFFPMLAALFFALFLYCYGRYWTHHKSNKVVMRNCSATFEKNKIRIVETDSESVGVFKNEEIYRVETLKDCYLLYVTWIQFFYLPKSAFRDENDRARFEKEILPQFQPLKRTLWKGIFLFLALAVAFLIFVFNC